VLTFALPRAQGAALGAWEALGGSTARLIKLDAAVRQGRYNEGQPAAPGAARPCPSCGQSLLPGEAHCPACRIVHGQRGDGGGAG
jgi:hypothetical protein